MYHIYHNPLGCCRSSTSLFYFLQMCCVEKYMEFEGLQDRESSSFETKTDVWAVALHNNLFSNNVGVGGRGYWSMR